MLNINQILKESFVTYKVNFKKIFWMVLPIFFFSVVSEYYMSVIATITDSGDYSNLSYFIISVIAYLISMLAISLFFGPVINRAIQKNEDNGNFDTQAAYSFQKKNIFKWIMVNIWGILYMIRTIWLYLLVSVLLIGLGFLSNDVVIMSSAIIASMIATAVGFILNISKFILYKNIFFSKDEVTARDAVRESIAFGNNKNGSVWMLVLILIITMIVMTGVYYGISWCIGLLSGVVAGDIISYLKSYISAIVSVIIFLPYISIILAKGYKQIRG